MATSSSLNSPNSNPTPVWKYHVFLSYRDLDARSNFIGHLYGALRRKGFIVFRVDKLGRGDVINRGPFQAFEQSIEQSLCSVVVLSKSYASSSWCLDELQKILDCRKVLGTEILPIFYGVDPSHVRYQKGGLAEAFRKHKKRFGPEKVQRWRDALREIANLSGYDSKNRSEGELVEEIINVLWTKLRPDLRIGSTEDFVKPDSKRPSIEQNILSDNETEVGSSDDDSGEDKSKLQDAQIEEEIFVFGSSFETLTVTDESQLKKLPSKLHSLRIVGCLLKSPKGGLEKKIASVSNLYAIDCPFLEYLVDEKISTSWRTLYIRKCIKLKSLQSSENFADLEHLCIGSSCKSLKNFTLNHFPKLKTLCIWDLPKLKYLSIPGNPNLQSVEIRDCPGLVSFPSNGLPTCNLNSLAISNCIALRSLPNHMGSLESLQTLFIDRCPELDSLPEGGLPSSLSLLSISFCDKLVPKKEWELNRLKCLTSFEIEGGCVGMESFPVKDLLPSNLNSLRISKLSGLSFLDYEGLQQLTALQSLDIDCCHKLSCIPDEGLPSSLASLSINESPLLTRDLMYKLEAGWDKIDHIPNIRIDGDFISSNSEEVSFILGNGII